MSYRLTVGSEWDISSASYEAVSFYVGSQDGVPYDIAFKDDGSKMYMLGSVADRIYQYSVNSAWLIDSSTYDGASFYVGSQDNVPRDIAFKDDGSKMYMLGSNTDRIYQYSVNSAWLIDSSTYDVISFYVGSQDGLPFATVFKDDGSKVYMVGAGNDSIYQYSLQAELVEFDPEYDYTDTSIKIEDRHRTRDASEFVYKWSDQKRISFSLSYLNSEDTNNINDAWRNNTDVVLRNTSNSSDIFSCHIVNKSLPIGQVIKPYNNLFKGKIELGTY